MQTNKPIPGDQIATKFDIEGAYNFWLFLPEDYGKSKKKFPLMIFLHGAGERGDNIDKVKVHGPPKLVEKDKEFPFILISPQCPKGSWWSPEILLKILDVAIEQYDVDESRIYLTGLSMGGFGTWRTACQHPDRFAAIIPICGGGPVEKADKLRDVPVWAFHGARDNVVALKNSQKMVKAVQDSQGQAKLTIYPEARHDSWTETYNNKEIYDWLLKHRKEKNTISGD